MKDESDTGNKNIVEGVVQKRLVFIRFIREKLEQGRKFRSENLQEESKGKLGKVSITSSLYKINKCELSKVRQSMPCNNSRPRFWLFWLKDSKVVYLYVKFCFRDCIQSFLQLARKLCFINFFQLPWLNTEAAVCRCFSKWVQNRCS